MFQSTLEVYKAIAKKVNESYDILLPIILVVVFYTGLDIYMNMAISYIFKPKYAMIVIGILSLPVICQRIRQGVLRLNSGLVVFTIIASFIFILSLAIHFDSNNFSLFKDQFSGLVFLLLCFLLFNNRAANVARRTVLICLIIAVLLSLIEVMHPGIFSKDPGRSAGFYINSNINALALNTGLVLAIGLLPPRMRIIFLVFVGAAVFGTISRSGMVIWAFIAFVLWRQGILHAERKRYDIFVHVFVLLCFIGFYYYAYINVPQFHVMADNQTNTFTDYSKDITISKKENSQAVSSNPEKTDINSSTSSSPTSSSPTSSSPTSSSPTSSSPTIVNEDIIQELDKKNSAAARGLRLESALALYQLNPVWGFGMARAWDTAPHNVYVLFAIAYGLVGWMIVPFLALIIFLCGDRRVSFDMALVFLLAGLISHNVMVDRTVLLPLALAAALKPEVFPRKQIKITHIITGLSVGGAEMMLYKLLSYMDRKAFKVEVISLTDIGPIGEKIQTLGVPVRALGMRSGVPNPLNGLRLVCWLRKDRPDIIQTWMYHADFIGGLVTILIRGIPVAWNIRQSNLDPQYSKRSTIWITKACAKLSRWLPTRIISCSEASMRIHIELGYSANKMVVIPNGFDLSEFKPNPMARQAVRDELGISEGSQLIGLIGRFDPQKDHHNFVKAAAILLSQSPEVHFILCGDGITWENIELTDWIEEAGIRENCHLMGQREDIPLITAALDIATSSSCSEGFPNVIGEAMACGIPCVVTDVGDSALIVGDTGLVVPPKNPQALAGAWQKLLELGPENKVQKGMSARHRVQENFSLPLIVGRYENLYQEIIAHVRY